MSQAEDMTAQTAGQETDQNHAVLDHEEISRLMVRARDAQYNPDAPRVKAKGSFESRSLVQLAMAAQQKRDSEAALAAADTPAADLSEELPQADTEAENQQPAAVEAAVDAAEDIGENAGENADGNAGEDAAEDEVEQVFTKAELAAEYERGVAAGKEAGHKAGHAEGHAAGLTEGQAKAAGELEATIQKFEAAAQALSQSNAVDLTRLEASLHDAVARLAADRAGVAIDAMPEGLAGRIEAMVAKIVASTEHPVISLNPEDLAVIAPLAEQREALKAYHFEADANLARGDICVSADGISVADTISGRMQSIPGADAAAPVADAPATEALTDAEAPAEAKAEAPAETSETPQESPAETSETPQESSAAPSATDPDEA